MAKYRGQAVIIVNKNFGRSEVRDGATEDFKNMYEMFVLLGFHVKTFWNLRGESMMTEIEKGTLFYNEEYKINIK